MLVTLSCAWRAAACTPTDRGVTTPVSRPPLVTPSPSRSVDPGPDPDPGVPRFRVVEDARAPVADDLARLARRFVRYARGNADTFPHRESITLSLGGRTVVAIDDVGAALGARRIWRICPAGATTYGAASCPVDLLGPLESTIRNRGLLVLTAAPGPVVCAPTRTGPPPTGRLVVLRPSRLWRTCASDFALVLAADRQGRLRSVDLTLSSP